MNDNLWHDHEDGYRGTHTHEIFGTKVQHTHTGDPDFPVVEAFGKRYKRPKVVATGDHVELEVQSSVIGHHATDPV